MAEEERIAKIIARSGVCSRRDAERLIEQGRVTYQGKIIDNPATKFTSQKGIAVDGEYLKAVPSKLWLYHKPVGLVVSHHDEQGRPTVFDYLPISERVISIGRLDMNTSGLLLLTNDGAIAREFELPANNWERVYMVRVYGNIDFPQMQKALAKPITIDGMTYKPIKISLEQTNANNHWLRLVIKEGKNREIRNILAAFDLRISKLIRIQYGNFELGNLPVGKVFQVDLDSL